MPSLVLFEKSKPISNLAALEFCFRAMFGEDPFVDIAAEQICRAAPTFSSVNSFKTLLMILKVLLGSASEIGIANVDQLFGTVLAYDEQSNKSINILDPQQSAS